MKDTNIESEVLGIFLNDYQAQLKIQDCREEFFTDLNNRITFKAIHSLFSKGEPIDNLTVTLRIRNMDKTANAGAIVSDISNRYIGSPSIDFKIKILHQFWIARGLQAISTDITHQVQDKNTDPFEVISATQRRLDELSVIEGGDGVHIAKVAADRVNEIAQRKAAGIHTLGVSTGWGQLDRFTGGFVPGEFWVVAGRPGMGKTSWATGIAIMHSLNSGGKVAFFSLEMTKEGLVDRILSAEFQTNGEQIRSANLSEEQILNMARLGRINHMNIWLDDTRRQTIDQIRGKLKMMKAKHGITLAIIDYIGLINPSDTRATREQQVAYISRQCKLIAGESGCTVMGLSQLNRQSEGRSDKRPGLADLRESGAIEQDADVVVFPFRPDYYLPEKPIVEEAETIVAKNRNGRTGIVECKFESAYSQYLLY